MGILCRMLAAWRERNGEVYQIEFDYKVNTGGVRDKRSIKSSAKL